MKIKELNTQTVKNKQLSLADKQLLSKLEADIAYLDSVAMSAVSASDDKKSIDKESCKCCSDKHNSKHSPKTNNYLKLTTAEKARKDMIRQGLRERFGGGGNGGLGTLGTSFHSLNYVCDLGNKKPLSADEKRAEREKADAVHESTTEQYAMKKHVGRLLRDLETPQGKTWGIHNCSYALKSSAGKKGVSIIFDPVTGFAKYSNLQNCDRPFCPLCEAKKANKNRKLLEAMRRKHVDAGGCVLLMTLTAPHQRTDALNKTLDKQGQALTRLNKMLSKDCFWEEFGGSVGAVKAWEIIYGFNGWHPHFHFLVYLKEDIINRDEKGNALKRELQEKLDVIENSIFDYWQVCCTRSGLQAPSRENGVDIQDGTHASRYITKSGEQVLNIKKDGWLSSDELTKSQAKGDKKQPPRVSDLKKGDKGFTIWQLEQMSMAGDYQASKLVIEYAYHTYNRSLLYWYQGTKKAYDLDAELKVMQEEKEAEIAEKYEDGVIPKAFIFLDVEPANWSAITYCDKEAHLLKAVKFDVENLDFIDKTTSLNLIKQCRKKYDKYLKEKEQREKAKIDSACKHNKKGHIKRDVDVNFRTRLEKEATKKIGSYGKELIENVIKINDINVVDEKNKTKAVVKYEILSDEVSMINKVDEVITYHKQPQPSWVFD